MPIDYSCNISELNDDDFVIKVVIPSIPTAGEAATLSCIIVPPDRFALGFASVVWAYDAAGTEEVDEVNSNAILGPLVKNSDGYSRNITLNPVNTSDARSYFCIYRVNASAIFDNGFTDFTVKSKYMYILISFL